jgi:putative flippase GtrA
VAGPLADRRVRYLAAGGISAVGYYGLFAAGWALLGGRVPYLLVAVVANLLTALITFRLYREGVFRAGRGGPRGFLRFYGTFCWGLVVTLVGLPLLVEALRIPVLPAQAAVLAVTPVVNYQLHRRWVFRKRPSGPAPE